FQAEDGIRDRNVTGVQTCALPISYGIKLDQQKIEQVDQAEIFLANLGFRQVRVRHHDNIARIEVAPEKIVDVMKHREKIQMKLSSLGFTYVSVDLQGYRTGSMNEELSKENVEAIG